ncbi:MAG: hypothetical protein OEW40_21445, partial [Cyclobacteriaceae bacterium]|nr:hypothetical protein [Cyclobacteriaceae bacterium]
MSSLRTQSGTTRSSRHPLDYTLNQRAPRASLLWESRFTKIAGLLYLCVRSWGCLGDGAAQLCNS